MPELPEVDTVIRALNRVLNGQQIKDIIVSYPKVLKFFASEQDFKNKYIGQKFGKVKRRAKYIIFSFQNDTYLLNHLRMEGKWFFEKTGSAFDGKHVLLRFLLDDGNELRYHDTRRFGTFEFRTPETLYSTNPLAKLGPEPLEDDFNVEYLFSKAQKKNISIKALLLDQETVVGIGNIYDSEICFQAKVHPEKVAKYLSFDECERLVDATKAILKEAIEYGGTTFDSFESEKNVHGMYFDMLKVYHREGQKCVVCGEPIKRIKQNNRSTFYCGQCQKF